ncbi:MAG: hypothetical protein KGL45_10915 [Gammaproteobacteria bacterium]|nr:hypothetical protein [Gammaproteobacteria bacterium]
MTDIDAASSPLAAFQGPVACRRTADALILTGAAADCADDILILTFIAPAVAGLPERLAGAAVRAAGGCRYRIVSGSRDWAVEAASVHVHRDIGKAFYRAVPPRPTPLKKRLLWGVVLALAGTRGGKRLLLSLRRPA